METAKSFGEQALVSSSQISEQHVSSASVTTLREPFKYDPKPDSLRQVESQIRERLPDYDKLKANLP
jgi:hypothetical protein